jgi:ubiquitin C-terminal hydrolase
VEGLFQIYIRSDYTCKRCKHIALQPVVANKSITVQLAQAKARKQPGQKLHLTNCLADFFATRITGVQCQNDNCKQSIDTSMHFRIVSAPETLVVQVARFGFNQASQKYAKDSTAVTIPHSLDLSKYADSKNIRDSNGLKYALSAVVQHHGNLGGGHYITRMTNVSGTWQMSDDFPARALRTRDLLLTPSGFDSYLLFYRSLDMRSTPFSRL